jgi:hypothetical protein
MTQSSLENAAPESSPPPALASVATLDVDPRWIAIAPSTVNLVLTLLAGVIALVLVIWLDMPDWVKLPSLIAIPIVLSWEAWHILQKNRSAVTAFHLVPVERDDAGRAADPDSPEPNSKSKRAGEPTLKLHLRARDGTLAEGAVMSQSFVSFYFVSILYRLDNDPAWRRWFPRALALWPDSVDRARARDVRVALKWR